MSAALATWAPVLAKVRASSSLSLRRDQSVIMQGNGWVTHQSSAALKFAVTKSISLPPSCIVIAFLVAVN